MNARWATRASRPLTSFGDRGPGGSRNSSGEVGKASVAEMGTSFRAGVVPKRTTPTILASTALSRLSSVQAVTHPGARGCDPHGGGTRGPRRRSLFLQPAARGDHAIADPRRGQRSLGTRGAGGLATRHAPRSRPAAYGIQVQFFFARADSRT